MFEAFDLTGTAWSAAVLWEHWQQAPKALPSAVSLGW